MLSNANNTFMMVQFHVNGFKGVRHIHIAMLLLMLIMLMMVGWNGRQVEARHALGKQRIQVLQSSEIPMTMGASLGFPIWRSTVSGEGENKIKGMKEQQHKQEDENDYYIDDDDDDDDDGDNLRDNNNDEDEEDDNDNDEEDYDENAPKIIINNHSNKEQSLKEDKLLRLIALKNRKLKTSDVIDDPVVNGRAVDHTDESRTFFKKLHGGYGGNNNYNNGANYGAGSNFPFLFIVPINMSNINNNNVTTVTTTTTTVAPARRIAYADNGYPQVDFYRSPYMPNSFRRRAQNDNGNAVLPYGLMTTLDGAQVLPVAAIHRTVGANLHYVPINLQRFGNSAGLGNAVGYDNSGGFGNGGGFVNSGAFGNGGAYGNSGGYANSGSVFDNSDASQASSNNGNSNNNEDDDYGDNSGNGLQSDSDGRFNLFSSRWRTNPNPNRNVLDNPNPFAAFANNFRRVQYL